MVDVAKLSVVVDADTKPAEAGLSSLNTKIGSTGSMLATAFGGAAIAGVAALGAGFVETVKSAADFEKQMSAISAVSGATAEEMELLNKTALQLGKDTSFSAKEAAAGMEELVKAGVSVEDVIGGAAKGALDLAAAGAVDVAEAAEIASNAMNVFGLKGSDMAHVADVIAGAANASAISVTDYKFSLSAAGAVAATVGIGFEDLSTAIAAMGNAGIKGSDAGTSLKTMLMNLQPSTNAQRDEFRRLGLETNNLEQGLEGVRKLGIEPLTNDWPGLNNAMAAHLGLSQNVASWTNKDHDAFDKLSQQLGATGSAFFDASGKAKSMADISQVLQDATKDMTEAQRLASLEILFGSDAIRAAAVLSKEGAAGMNELAGSMAKVTAEAVAQERLDNLAGAWEQLQGSLETAAIMIGQQLLPVLTDLVTWATGGVNEIIDGVEHLGEVFDAMSSAWNDDANAAIEANARLEASLAKTFDPEVAAAIAQTMTDLGRTVKEVTDAMATAFETDGERTTTAWNETWKAVVLEATARTQELLGIIRIFALAVQGDYAAMWKEIVELSETEGKRQVAVSQANADLATQVIDGFTKGGATMFRTFFDQLDDVVVNGWNGLVGAFEQAGRDLRATTDAIGRSVVDGMRAGMEGAIGGLKSWVTENLTNALPEWVRSALKISSPSQVFVEIGAQVVAGLIAGLGRDKDALLKKAGEMASKLVSRFEDVGGSGGEVRSYIVKAAAERGIDPRAALAIAKHEGGEDDYMRVGKFKTGWSFWPFQLHYGGKGYESFGTTAGMGNDFTRRTGWQPGDVAAWADSIDFALDHARRYGWSAWYGRGPAGIGAWEGIPGHAEGGVFTRPHLAWIAENGPEAVVPLGRSGGYLSEQAVRIDVAVGGRLAEEIYVTGRDLAIRRGRAPTAGVA